VTGGGAPLGSLLGGVAGAVEELGQAVQKTGAAASATVSAATDVTAGTLGAAGGVVGAVAPTAPTVTVSAAEPGISTSELKLAVGAIVGILGVFGVSVGAGTQATIVGAVSGSIAVITAGYGLFRTWRKNHHSSVSKP
jgi:hypothetical protein